MTISTSSPARRGLFLKRLFTDQTEESFRLRVLILATQLWVAVSVYWVTGSPPLPLIASGVAVAGHWVSWRRRGSSMALRSLGIVVLIVSLSIVSRDTFVNALTGDRLPIAEYLLLVNAIASFGLKTRGGLYAQLAMSGIVLFFVSERAFDQTFVSFLVVFVGLFFTFMVMAFMEDQLSAARVHWPQGQLGRFWFWLAVVGGGLLACSALAFSLLPPDPRGRPGAQREGIVPFMGEVTSDVEPVVLPRMPLGPDGLSEVVPSADSAGPSPQPDAEPLQSFADLPPDGIDISEEPPRPEDVVMHVRSRVTSFWRGRIFDEFNGRTWFSSDGRVLSRAHRGHRNYYWQAFFVTEDQPGALFVGYNPVRVILPPELRETRSLAAGSTYSVLSQQPSLSLEQVRFDRPGRVGAKYTEVHPSIGNMHQIAQDIVGDAVNPFEKLWKIVSYLRSRNTFNVVAEDQAKWCIPQIQ